MQPDEVKGPLQIDRKAEMPSLRRENKLLGRVRNAAKQSGIPTASEVEPVLIHASKPAAGGSPEAEKAPNVHGAVAQVKLAEMAEKLRKGGTLVRSEKGHLRVQRETVGGSVPISPKSGENARLFLRLLVQNRHGNGHDALEKVRTAFKSFIASDWLKSVLQKEPGLGADLEFTAAKIFGISTEQAHRVFLEGLHSIKAAEDANPLPSQQTIARTTQSPKPSVQNAPQSPVLPEAEPEDLEAKKASIRAELSNSGVEDEVEG